MHTREIADSSSRQLWNAPLAQLAPNRLLPPVGRLRARDHFAPVDSEARHTADALAPRLREVGHRRVGVGALVLEHGARVVRIESGGRGGGALSLHAIGRLAALEVLLKLRLDEGVQRIIAVCLACPIGTFQAEPSAVAASQCVPCEEGTYSDTEGAASCTAAGRVGSYITLLSRDVDGIVDSVTNGGRIARCCRPSGGMAGTARRSARPIM